MEVPQTSFKTAPNGRFRNVVSTLGHPHGNACDSRIRRIQRQKHQSNEISLLTPQWNLASVRAARKGCLEGEALTPVNVSLDQVQHHSSSRQGGSLRLKRRNSRGDQIGIQKGWATSLESQKLPGEGGLAGPVGTGEDENRRPQLAYSGIRSKFMYL